MSALAAVLAFLCCACASLTRLVIVAPEEATQEEAGSEDPGALARYLRLRKVSVDSTVASRPHVAVLPFENPSGFREDVWDIEREMAALLSAEMVSVSRWRVVPFEAVDEAVGERRNLKPREAVEVGRVLEADVVLLGVVEDYDLKRISVGDPLVGGYKSYTGVAGLHVQALRVADESRMGTAESDQELTERDVGLDLLGRPRAKDVEFINLKGLAFGSKEFHATMIGQATMAAVEDVIGQLIALFRPTELELDGRAAEIISVYGTDVFINIGSESGARAGYRFVVYPGLQRVREQGADAQTPLGVIEVRQIVGARLSSVRVLEGLEYLQAGDRLKALVIDSE
ncbi:MAG: hypothetical protein O7D35_07155 [Acidobacteria bacterium]|nr:hypothetical protein [Acidobacteriota bacterium]